MASIWSATGCLGDVDRLAAEAGRLGQALGDPVPDDDHGRAQQVARGGTSQPDRSRTGDVDNGPGTDTCAHGPVEPGREDVRQTGEVLDLGQGLVSVREAQEVEVGVGDHDVLSLPSDPPSHVDIAVGGPGTGGFTFRQIPVLPSLQLRQRPQAMLKGTETRSPTFTNSTSRPASMTSPVISCPRTNPAGRRSTAPHHVLVAPADIGAHDLEDHAVVAATVAQGQDREINGP
jgi:hypothetical protein